MSKCPDCGKPTDERGIHYCSGRQESWCIFTMCSNKGIDAAVEGDCRYPICNAHRKIIGLAEVTL